MLSKTCFPRRILLTQRIRSRSVLITGGGSGLGEAIARRLVNVEGYSHVTIADIDEEAGMRLVDEIPGIRFVRADVTKPEDIAHAVKEAAMFSDDLKLHALVNNAGIVGPLQTYASYDIEDWHKVLNVNLNGVFYGLKYGLAHMVEQTLLANEQGTDENDFNFSIVNMSSTAGFRGIAQIGPYTAAKWAVNGMTQAAAVEYAPYKIRVNAIAPTTIETPMFRHVVAASPDPEAAVRTLTSMNALPGFPQPDDVAGVCAFLLSREAQYITGHTLPVDAGALARLV